MPELYVVGLWLSAVPGGRHAAELIRKMRLTFLVAQEANKNAELARPSLL